MKKSLINTMILVYGENNKWVNMFIERVANLDDENVGDRQLIRQHFAYCDLNAKAAK